MSKVVERKVEELRELNWKFWFYQKTRKTIVTGPDGYWMLVEVSDDRKPISRKEIDDYNQIDTYKDDAYDIRRDEQLEKSLEEIA